MNIINEKINLYNKLLQLSEDKITDNELDIMLLLSKDKDIQTYLSNKNLTDENRANRISFKKILNNVPKRKPIIGDEIIECNID